MDMLSKNIPSRNKISKINLTGKILFFILAITLPLIWFGSLRICSFGNAENDPDCYYHVTMADIGPKLYMSKQFPFTTLSNWKDQFSDKELGFHMILTGIRSCQRFFNLGTKPPFHFPALIMIAIMLSSFVFACHQFKCRHAAMFSMLLVCISPLFCFRVLMLRPHVLSISLMLLSAVYYHKTNTGKTLVYPVIIGFVFSWSYSNPHFVLLPATAFALVKWRDSPGTALLLPCLTVAGLLAGYTLHPQFPNTFINWKIQSIDVVLQSLQNRIPAHIGTELSPPSGQMLRFNFPVYLLFAANAFLVFRKLKSEGLNNAGPSEALFAISAVALLGFFAAQRAIEYACPFNILCFATLVSHPYYAERRSLSSEKLRYFMVSGRILIILLSASMWLLLFKQDLPLFKPLDPFSAWAKKSGIPDGTIIANLFWSDFPFLFHSAPQFYYLSGIDPTFSFYHEPEAMNRIEDFRTGKRMLTPQELSQITKARFAFVSAHGRFLAKAMSRNGYPMVYHGPDGWLFSLPE